MKKIWTILLIGLLTLLQVVPARADGKSSDAVLVQILAPAEANAGDTVRVVLQGYSQEADAVSWLIYLPKATIASVANVYGSVKSYRVSQNAWVFSLNQTVEAKTTFSASFDVVLVDAIGSGLPLVSVQKGKKVLGEAWIDIQNSLNWSIETPGSAVYGSRPLPVKVTVTNTSATEEVLDVLIRLSPESTSGVFSYSTSGGQLYGFRADEKGTSVSWRGVIPSGGSYTLVLTAITGNLPGVWPLVSISDPSTGEVFGSSGIQITESGGGKPYGELLLTDLNGGDITVGDEIRLDFDYYSPVLGLFVITDISSTCPLSLPTRGEVSADSVSYAHFSYTVRVEQVVKTGQSPYVTCSVTTSFYMWENTTRQYKATRDFQVFVP